MEPVKILEEINKVDKRLKKMGLTRSELKKVVDSAVLARRSCTKFDTANAAGSMSYFAGSRGLRESFCRLGWLVDRKDSVESIINSQGSIKIIFQNVDCASVKSREPRARSKKGPGSERTVAHNQMIMFSQKELRLAMPTKIISAWYFCVSVNQSGISAELSLPKSVDGGQFSGFLERIFILQDGELSKLSLSKLVVDNYKEFKVNVARK